MCILLTIASYGFVRLPLPHASISAVFFAMATLLTIYLSDVYDPIVMGRLVTYLIVANIAGLILHRITEMRERRLFLQAVRLKNVAALRQKLIEAESAANEAKTRFLAMLSHEIRTPMHAIVGLLDMVQDDLKEQLDSKKLRAFELVSRSCDGLLATFDDMLEYAQLGHIDAAQRVGSPTIFHLDQVIEESCQLFEYKAEEKKISLTVDTTDIYELALLGDPAKMARVITNLVSNAIKFTNQGWIKVAASYVLLENDQAQINITVSDSGVGIPKADLPRIFQAFYQVDASYARRYEGSGLGLAICKQIISAMSGSITVSSELGQGTRFSILLRLPLAYAHAKTIAPAI
jgi:signal transduction histidine kinase